MLVFSCHTHIPDLLCVLTLYPIGRLESAQGTELELLALLHQQAQEVAAAEEEEQAEGLQQQQQGAACASAVTQEQLDLQQLLALLQQQHMMAAAQQEQVRICESERLRQRAVHCVDALGSVP